MNDRSDAQSTAPGVPLPSTSSEMVTAIVHFHRAEISRMAGWRNRIDQTTNWAITVVAAMLSVSLSTPSSHHGVLLFAMVLVYLLLWIEARRYRFFDVYRARVRQIERHYLAQLFCPIPDPSESWQQALGQSLREPHFHLTYGQAFSRRLRRNYIWMFLILLTAWVLKLSTPGLRDEGLSLGFVGSIREAVAGAALGPIPGLAIVIGIGMFYAWLLWASFRPIEDASESGKVEVHV
jgi:uncharacterized membrane protein